eukprot:Clim_evm4s227 gene=Clim_evmTU4s227
MSEQRQETGDLINFDDEVEVTNDTTALMAEKKGDDGVPDADAKAPADDQVVPEVKDKVPAGDAQVPDVSHDEEIARQLQEEVNRQPERPPLNARDSLPADVYVLKSITHRKNTVKILLQNQNGPCPLIALCNALCLRGKMKLNPENELVTFETIANMMSEFIINAQPPPEASDDLKASFDHNKNDAISLLPQMQDGLDVNVHFDGVRKFEYTPQLAIFDIMNVNLYHGWVVDPNMKETAEVLGSKTYNQVIEDVIVYRESESTSAGAGKEPETPEKAAQRHRGFLIDEFLKESQSQLTWTGMADVTSEMQDGETAVFFRNNHFTTIHKHNGVVYSLATDRGFAHTSIVWETLSGVDGNSVHVDGNFVEVTVQEGQAGAPPASGGQSAEDADYQLAMSMQQEYDSQIAARMSGSPRNAEPVQAEEGNDDPDYQLALQMQRELDLEDQQRRQQGQRSRQRSPARPAESGDDSEQPGQKPDKKNCIVM